MTTTIHKLEPSFTIIEPSNIISFTPEENIIALKFLSAMSKTIEAVEVLEDGSLYLKTKNHLVIDSGGHQIFHSKDGQVVIKSNMIHLNPSTPINKIQDPQLYVEEVETTANEMITKTNDVDCGCVK